MDGGDKDSTDNVDEIYSTQQPEDPSECTEPVSLAALLLLWHWSLSGFQQNHYPCPTAPYTVVDSLATTV